MNTRDARQNSGIGNFVHLWYTYGADDSERVKRIVIAVGALIALAAGMAVLTHAVSFAIPNHMALAKGIAARFRPRDFAYVMTILTALTAAACTAFFGFIVPQTQQTNTEDHDARWALTALMISLVAAIAATLSFAAIYSSGSVSEPTPHRVLEFHMLIMAFLQLAISLSLVSVTVIPIISNRPGPILGSVVSAISTFWWLPAGWVVFFLLELPELFDVLAGTFCLLLFLTMAQIFYPHGWHRTAHPKSYPRTLRGLMYSSYFGLGGCVIGAGYCVIADIITGELPPPYYAWSTCILFISVGLALWAYSTSTEGQRKFSRYSTGLGDTLERRD